MAANERKILTTLSIGGEKEFKAAMDSAYSSMKVLSSELKANSAEFDKNDKSVENLTKRGSLLRKEVDQQKEIVNALSKAVDESAEAYGEDSKQTDNYRIKLNNAQAALSKMERDLKENNKTLSDAKSKTKALADGLKDFGEKAEKAGKKVEDVGNKVSVMSAAAAAAAAALVAVTTESAKWADALNTQSAQTNISTETLQKWTYAANFIDTSVETMTGSMVKMVKQMDAARNGTKLSEEAFKKLGVKIKDDVTGELRDSETVFFEAIDALGKMKNETDRDALSLQIFGKSAMELNPLIKAGSDKLKELGEEAEATGIIIGEDGVASLQEYDDTMRRLDAQVTASKNKLAIQLAPTIETIIKKVTEAVSAFGEWVKTLDSGTVETILKVTAIVAAAGPLLIIIGKVTQGIGAVSSALAYLIANPAALAVVAIVAVTAAIVAWSLSMKDSNSISAKMSEKAKQRTQEIKEQKEAYYDLKNAQAEQAEGDLAQLQNTENLRAELKNLVDAQGNVAEKDKARVSYILNEINEAYGTELTLINDNIAGYQAQMDAIDQLVEKRKYEILQEAALPAYKRAVTDEINLRMQAELDLAALEEAKAARDAEYSELVEKYGQERVDAMTMELDGVKRIALGTSGEYNSLAATVESYQAAYDASTEAIKNNLSDQTTYQKAELLAQQGHWEEAAAAFNWYASGRAQKYEELRGNETAQREYLESEYTAADNALKRYLANVLNGTEEYNESTVRSLAANATDLYNKAKEGGANVGDGLIAGIDEKNPGVTTSISSVADTIVNTLREKMDSHSPSLVTTGIGRDIVQGLEDGIKGKTSAASGAAITVSAAIETAISKNVNNPIGKWLSSNFMQGLMDGLNGKRKAVSATATEIANGIVSTFRNAWGEHSPSTVMAASGRNLMLGLANGISDNAGMVDKALSSVMPDTKTMALSMDVSRNFYDLASTAATSSKATQASGYGALGESIASAIPAAQITIELDGKKVGQGTAKYVSDVIASSATVRMRSGAVVSV